MLDVMTVRTGVMCSVSEELQRAMVDEYLPRIREFSGRSLEPKDIIVRGTHIINTARDHYYSRFTREALDEVAELLPGRPLMASHNYGTFGGAAGGGLPLGRFFAATVVKRGVPSWLERDSHWVDAMFYLPNDEEGQRIAKRIDLGVYKDTSLAWRCASTKCSVCEDDIRVCGHIPGEVYERGGIAEYSFAGVTGVAEGSLVYSGGQKETITYKPRGEERSGSGIECITWDRMADFKRALLASEEGITGVSLRSNSYDQPIRRNLFAVECDASRFSEAQAAKWCREHGFRADKREKGKAGYLFVQHEADARGGSKRIQLEENVHGLMLKERDSKRSESDDTLEGVNLA